jgi:hypothetical protein
MTLVVRRRTGVSSVAPRRGHADMPVRCEVTEKCLLLDEKQNLSLLGSCHTVARRWPAASLSATSPHTWGPGVVSLEFFITTPPATPSA